MTIFETERLIVRHYTVDDKQIFSVINGDEEVMRYIRALKQEKSVMNFWKKFLLVIMKILVWAVGLRRKNLQGNL